MEDNPANYDFGGHDADGWGDDGIGMDHAIESPARQSHPSTLGPQSTVFDVDADDARINMNSKLKPKSPFRVESDTEESSNSSATESSSSSAEMTAKDRKRLKALQRMMPAAMARRLVENAQQTKATAATAKRRSVTAEVCSDVEAGPLLPGQTRVRTGGARKRDMDIRGDTESSDEESQNPALDNNDHSAPHMSSDSDVEVIGIPARKRDRVALVELTKFSDYSDDEGSSDDDEVDDDKIDAWLGNGSRSAGPGTLREESLVDWMLTRTRTVGGTGKQRERKKKPPACTTVRRTSVGNGRVHVVTAGAQKERQTLLSFGNHSKAKRNAGGRNHHHRSGVLRRTSLSEGPENDAYDDPESIAHPAAAKVAMRSAVIRKKRKAGAQGQLYVFTSKGTRITSGCRRTESAITIDMEDEGFHQALAPRDEGETVTRHHFPTRRRAKPKTVGVHDFSHATLHMPMDFDIEREPLTRHVDQPVSSEHRRKIEVDFNIPFLPSGIAFGTNSYIGKGFLRDLITAISGNDDVAHPHTYAAHGIELGPSMSLSDISNALVSVCDGLLDFVFGPVDGSPAGSDQWEGLIRIFGQILSWFPVNATAEDCAILENGLQEHLLRLILQVEERDDAFGADGEPLNAPIFTIYWFAIESSVRFYCSIQKTHPALVVDTKNLVKYISLLARRLQDYGLHRTLEPIIKNPDELSIHIVPQRTAELWVCLFHLVSSYNIDSTDGSTMTHHPFWRIMQLTLQLDDGSPPSGLEASEHTWRIIFSMCALSQFSIHGMTTSTCRLTTSWELVVFALKQIRLLAEPDGVTGPLERSLGKRDEYIWVITARCFILCSRWRWRLDNGPAMFNQLVGIFGSRKFTNLRHERSDFPAFMRKNDLQLLYQYKPRDTAFELLLKIIVQVTSDNHTNDARAQRLVSPTLKKFIAVAIPVGSVPFTKSTPPTKHELSMLYNRFSVIAVAIYLENSPADARRRLAQARRYVNFRDANNTTRVACMRGVMYLAIIMRYRHLPLDEILSWLAEMTNILVDEYLEIDGVSKANTCQTSNAAKHRAILSVQVLLGSVRLIIESSNIDPKLLQKRYPEPALLDGREFYDHASNSNS